MLGVRGSFELVVTMSCTVVGCGVLRVSCGLEFLGGWL
jgi:hypothetical protein